MAARKRSGTKTSPWPERVRERIQASMLHNELIKAMNGQREMDATQARIALGLLNKVLPDLTKNETSVSGELTVKIMQFSGNNTPK